MATRPRTRNLVVVRAGDASRHPLWLRGEKDFDLLVEYYGGTPGRYSKDADHYHVDEVNDLRTFGAVHRLLKANPNYLEDYDCFFFPDDDIETDGSTISALFSMHSELGLGISQPALTEDSYFSHSMLLTHRGLALRQVNFVEVMCPMFSRQVLVRCLPTFAQSVTSWGLDWVWQTLLPSVGQRAAVIDCLPVRHSRPVGGGENYVHLTETPFEEARRVCAGYGVLPAQRMRVERAWGTDLNPVPTASLAQRLLSTRPLPTLQAVNAGDGYLDFLRRQARTGRVPQVADLPEGAGERRERILRGVRGDVGGTVAPSGWSSAELELTRASHAAHEADGGGGAGWRSHESVGRLLGALVRDAARAERPLSIGYAADDPEVLRAVCRSAAGGVRVVVCVDVGELSGPTVARMLAGVRAVGLREDEVDVEVREQVADAGLELDLDCVRRTSPAPWRPGLPVPVDPLTIDDLLSVVAAARATAPEDPSNEDGRITPPGAAA